MRLTMSDEEANFSSMAYMEIVTKFTGHLPRSSRTRSKLVCAYRRGDVVANA